jgi:hypothetical protein
MAGMLGFKVVTQYERGIVFRWGRVLPAVRELGPTWVNPFTDRLRKVNMQIVVAAVPAQLRLLQTVVEVAAEKNSTLVMPVPVELLRFFDRAARVGNGARPVADATEDAGVLPPAPGTPARKLSEVTVSARGPELSTVPRAAAEPAGR